MSNLELLDRAASSTTCQILGTFGSGLVQASAFPLYGPQGRLVALGAGGVMMLASNYLCSEMPLGNGGRDYQNGCQKVDGYGLLEFGDLNGFAALYPPGTPKYNEGATAVEILETSVFLGQQTGKWVSYVKWRYLDGETDSADVRSDTQEQAEAVQWRINPTNGTCERDSEDPSPLPPEIYEPITYVDSSTNCTYEVNLEGFVQPYEGGNFEPVFQVKGASGTRANGGVMGGCNFAPVIYMPITGGPGGGGPGGPGITFPVPDDLPDPDGDLPWWLKPLISGLAGGTVSAILQTLLGGGGGGGGGEIEPATYEMIAPCDFTEDGSNQNRIWEFDVPYIIPRMVQHQVALMEMLQQHLNWKTPTCGSSSEKPPLEGQWVTTRWESIEKMAHSGRRLRKLFRYRTKSSRDLGQLSAYWADFSWRAGDVCVRHTGAWWGDPQVWAESEDEGQRVIRHAAAEAGIDPDQIGRWATSSSRSPRYGMSGTMKVALFEGFPWIASRDGAEWPNVLAKSSDP